MKGSTYRISFSLTFLICILLFIAIVISIRSLSTMREVITSQFKNQQLLLARQISKNLGGNFKETWNQLQIISSAFSAIKDTNNKVVKRIFTQSFEILKQLGIKGIWIYDKIDKKIVFKKGKIIQNKIILYNDKEGGYSLSPLVFIYKHKISPRYFIFAYIDTYSFTQKIAEHINLSSNTYAWIINDKGFFIYHPIKEFVGQNAFTIRHKKAPYFNFAEINRIQRNDMLKGKEGTGLYFSMWHENETGKIKKIMAYSPLYVPHSKTIWSIAVCTSEEEINKSIKNIYVKELFAQGILIFSLIFIFAGAIILEKRFNIILKKEVEEKTKRLRESRERYKLLIESAEDLILTLNDIGEIISFNKATNKFFKEDKEKIIEKKFYELMQWSEEDFKIALNRIFKENRSFSKEHLVDIKGISYWLNTKLMPLQFNKKEREIFCISRDITKEKEIQQYLINTEKLASLGTLAAGVAHEINNPLGIIIGFGELLLENTEDKPTIKKDLEIILKHAYHCKEIVENLLNFARTSQEFYETTDINEAIKEVISLITPTLKKNNIILNTYLSKGLALVKGEKRKLQQVFLNIIINAVDAMPNGGKLNISTKIDRFNVIISIKDSGYGIKQEHKDKIFDPFFTTKPEGKGTGLGLSISYGIIKNYGGSIEVKTKEGEGSNFIIKLPRAGEI